MEVIVVTFCNAVVTVDVLIASNNDMKLVETLLIIIVHFVWLFTLCFILREQINLTAITRIANFYHLIAP